MSRPRGTTVGRFAAAPRTFGALSFVAAVAFSPAASARVEFEIDYVDAAGEGFFDETRRAALDDNPGSTLGEQRRLAFEHALEVWARALQSPVSVRIEATFAPIPELPCEQDAAVLGAARAEAGFAGFAGAPRSDLFYPSPLADKLAGVDLDPMAPDLSALLNPRVDDADCLGAVGWDYSLSGDGGEAGLVSTVLHELAHGLGFASLADESTGDAADGLSIFDAFMFDHQTGLTWDVMSNEQRQASVTSPYDLVWLGEHVTQAAEGVLARGAPRLELPDGSELSAVSEPSFAPFLGSNALSGDLLVLTAAEACSGRADLQGAIVLLDDGPGCGDLLEQLRAVARRGAVAALTRSLLDGEPPWGVVSAVARADIPSLALAQEDFDGLVARLLDEPLSATLRTDDQLLGTDSQGRVRLSATRPVQPGSSGSHWDASVRRIQESAADPVSLLMEPAAAGTFRDEVSDLTVQLLQDIGWDDEVCGNGIVEGQEECDDGIGNDDQLADACRSSCRVSYCGDGVVDSAERCDRATDVDCNQTCQGPVETEPVPDAAAEGDGGLAAEPSITPGKDRPSEPEPTAAGLDAGTGAAGTETTEVALAQEGCSCRLPARGPRRRLLPLVLTALLVLRLRGRVGRSPSGRS